jgi:hypothetical protein
VGGARWTHDTPHESMIIKHHFTSSPAYVAASLPYGIQEIDKLEADVKDSPFVEVLVPSRSCEGRPVRLFQMTDPAVPNQGKRAVYIQTGQHSPPEMIAGRALDSAIRCCANPDAALRQLLGKVILLFVPVVNQDTAFHGTSSSVACGVNLNRDWWEPRSPEVTGLKAFIVKTHETLAPIEIAIDFHGGGWAEHTILCRNEAVNEAVFKGCHAIQERFLKALSEQADFHPRAFSRQGGEPRSNDQGVPPGIFSVAMRQQLGITAMTPEMSCILRYDRKNGRCAPISQESFVTMGPDLLRTIAVFAGLDAMTSFEKPPCPYRS